MSEESARVAGAALAGDFFDARDTLRDADWSIDFMDYGVAGTDCQRDNGATPRSTLSYG